MSENRMYLSEPSLYMLLNKSDDLVVILRFSWFEIPPDLCKFALVHKSGWQVLVLYSAVKFMVILRRSELKQKLFDLFVDGMASEQFEVGGVINLFCEDFTKIMEGIESFLFQTFMDLFEDFSVI